MSGDGHVVYVQVKVAADGDGWERTLRLCESRIAQRGDGHRTLKAKTPQLKQILMRRGPHEPLLANEISHIGIQTNRYRRIIHMHKYQYTSPVYVYFTYYKDRSRR